MLRRLMHGLWEWLFLKSPLEVIQSSKEFMTVFRHLQRQAFRWQVWKRSSSKISSIPQNFLKSRIFLKSSKLNGKKSRILATQKNTNMNQSSTSPSVHQLLPLPDWDIAGAPTSHLPMAIDARLSKLAREYAEKYPQNVSLPEAHNVSEILDSAYLWTE